VNDQSRRTEPKDPRVEAALRDYLEGVDRGEAVDLEEFLSRHAEIADQLRSFIAAEDEVRKLAGAGTPLDLARDSTKSFVGHGQETIAPQSAAQRAAETGGTELTGQFDRYRIIRALGKGAMGAVYLAEDTQLERSVAIKTPHFAESQTEESLERFYREARAAATLRHANICPVHDVGQIDGKHYISMAYIEGRPLSAFVRPDKQQTERQILIVVRKLALALQEAHDHGVVHRDLKPANIMVDKKGEPIIMDFGLAQQTRREGDVRLTQTGNILGTPAYMSPEQVGGEPEKVGFPTDQYSLGVILYELLTGQLPFRGSAIAVMGQILTKEVPPPSQLRSALDPRIEAVCLKMMAKNPSQRLASLKLVADELATLLKNPAAKPRPQDTGSQAARATQSPSASSDRLKADLGASQALKSLKPMTLKEADLASLEELARKCLGRRDYEQVIQVIERIPEERRNAGLVALLENARAKADEITFLICDIDEAERLNDAPTALKKAEALLKVKPGHHRALQVQEKYSGYGEGRTARIGPLGRFTQPWNKGGWIPRKLVAFGLAAFAVMACVIVIYVHKTTIVIDTQDPNVVVSVKGTKVEITGSTTKVVQEPPSAPRPRNTGPPPATFKNSLGMEFVLVPKGKSWLGGGGGRPGDKELAIDQDFHLGKYEVTQGEWATVTGRNRGFFRRGKSEVENVSDAELTRFPVEHVSWVDTQDFLERLNKEAKETGWIYRLPKEAEWEYACRGGPLSDKVESAYYFYFDKPTNELLPEQANFKSGNGLNRTCKVGSYQPNRLGLYDMHGNVWEWCDDADQRIQDGAHLRAMRGGGWYNPSKSCEAASRDVRPPWVPRHFRNDHGIGLRVARVPVGPEVVKIPPEEQKAGSPAATGSADPDRTAAEWVLSIGGTITISENGQQRQIKDVADLARGAFDLTEARLDGSAKVSDEGLACFKGCKNLTYLSLEKTRVGDAGMSYFKDCKNLSGLDLGDTRVSDVGLSCFKDCKGLTELFLEGTKLGDAGLANFEACKNLTNLSLGGTQVSDVGLANFKDCKKLTNLRLYFDTKVSDVGLAYFKGCRNLSELNLAFIPVSDVGLAYFKGCENLIELILDNTRVSDAGMSSFKDCGNLSILRLNGTKVSDRGLANLEDCRNLTALHLYGTEVTDAALERLSGFRKLVYVLATKTNVTEAGVKKLAAARPRCKIEWDGGVIEP
jgi:serine/threonine protein kinase/formylglycine-generating enzyme required for sulfatase activity/Leucine-rich repeat (LRR) protein